MRYFAVPQKLKNRGKSSRLCLSVDRLSRLFAISTFSGVLLLNGSELGLQYLQGFQLVHHIRYLALLGCHHVDTTRHNRDLLAPTFRALRLRHLMLGDGLGALERLTAFLATILVGWHNSGADSQDIRDNASDHPAEDHLHFVEREGPQCLGADIATRADTQGKRDRGLIVRRLADRNDVVLTSVL